MVKLQFNGKRKPKFIDKKDGLSLFFEDCPVNQYKNYQTDTEGNGVTKS
jgi:hypothetical protein